MLPAIGECSQAPLFLAGSSKSSEMTLSISELIPLWTRLVLHFHIHCLIGDQKDPWAYPVHSVSSVKAGEARTYIIQLSSKAVLGLHTWRMNQTAC